MLRHSASPLELVKLSLQLVPRLWHRSRPHCGQFHQNRAIIFSNGRKDLLLVVHIVSIGNLDAIDKSAFAEAMLGDAPGGFCHSRLKTMVESLCKCHLDQALSYTESRRFLVHPEHEYVQILPWKDGLPGAEPRVESAEH